MNKSENSSDINKNLKELQDLVKHLIAVQLYIGRATQNEICENLSISKTTVNNMVKGIKKDVKPKMKKEKGKQKTSRNANQVTIESKFQTKDDQGSNSDESRI